MYNRKQNSTIYERVYHSKDIVNKIILEISELTWGNGVIIKFTDKTYIVFVVENRYGYTDVITDYEFDINELYNYGLITKAEYDNIKNKEKLEAEKKKKAKELLELKRLKEKYNE